MEDKFTGMKISIVMQVYLGEYPGSRKNSDKKFIRAIDSFINQTYKNSELIIVSDGCEITHKLYYEKYKNETRIKYVYVDKDTPNMYEGEKKYYRGLPREVGRSIASGDVIAYMDSDDYLIPNFVETIHNVWQKTNMQYDVLLNQSWYDNSIVNKINNFYGEHIEIIGNDVKFSDLESSWIHVKMKTIYYNCAPWLVTHKSDLTIKWRDVYDAGTSEDVDFINRIKQNKNKMNVYSTPKYVRCHYHNKWDY